MIIGIETIEMPIRNKGLRNDINFNTADYTDFERRLHRFNYVS